MEPVAITHIYKIKNLNDLEQLIDRANSELQSLQETIKQIKQFEFVLEKSVIEGHFKPVVDDEN